MFVMPVWGWFVLGVICGSFFVTLVFAQRYFAIIKEMQDYEGVIVVILDRILGFLERLATEGEKVAHGRKQ